jgi:hypothetical protein
VRYNDGYLRCDVNHFGMLFCLELYVRHFDFPFWFIELCTLGPTDWYSGSMRPPG